MRLLGIAGSLREGSYNRGLLRAAAELAPAGVVFEEHGLRGLPFYDGDLEAAGDPVSVVELKDAIRRADALVIATPEYNRGLPGVLKNALDWASRPALASPLAGKPVAIMGATTGFAGTARAQQQLRDALEFPGALVLQQPEVLVSEAYLRFDEHGDLVDDEVREQIAELLAELTRAPAQAVGLGSLPLEADPRVEEPVGEVDDQRQEDDRRRDDEDHGHDQRQVVESLAVDRLHHGQAEAVQAEHRLHVDGGRQRGAHVHRQHRGDRQQRDLEDVLA
jgi:chromate reductase, NAD(P)H dehydrogenase (quinone)